MSKDIYKMRREAFKLWNLVRLIFETLRYIDLTHTAQDSSPTYDHQGEKLLWKHINISFDLGGHLANFLRFVTFPFFAEYQDRLRTEYHVYISQMSPQRIYSNTNINVIQRIKEVFLMRTKIVITEKLTNRALVTPTPYHSTIRNFSDHSWTFFSFNFYWLLRRNTSQVGSKYNELRHSGLSI